MAIPVFPTSIRAPEYPLTEKPEDAVIRSTMEDGTQKTRPRFTRNRFTFELSWSAVPQTEKDALETFYRTATKNGALSFNWTHPASDKTLTVRFSEPPNFSLQVLHYWKMSIKIVEV